VLFAGIWEKPIKGKVVVQALTNKTCALFLEPCVSKIANTGSIKILLDEKTEFKLPKSYLPLVDTLQPVIVLDEGEQAFGVLHLKNDGALEITNGFGDFNLDKENAKEAGLLTANLIYLLA
jgi:hypothetical protein